MLRIRPEQMSEFGDAARARYKRQLLELISTAYPKHFAALGKPGVEALIDDAIESGKRYGIVKQGDISAFAELMVRFGRRFELSPDREWAQKVLNKPALPGAAKVSILWERMDASTGGRVINPPRPEGV